VVIDTATNSVVTTIPIMPPTSAAGIAVAPDGSRLYVVNYTDPGGLTTIDTATLGVVGTLTFSPATDYSPGQRLSRRIAVRPDGRRAYVTNTYDTLERDGCLSRPHSCPLTVTVVDLTQNRVVDVAPDVGAVLGGIAVDPSGNEVYVANQTDVLLGFYVGPFGIAILDTFTNTSGRIRFGYSEDVAVNRAGTRVYATSPDLEAVVVVDADTREVVAQVHVPTLPQALAVNQAGTRVYVTDYPPNTVDRGSVWVLDAASNTAHQATQIGYLPCGIAIGPDVIGTLTPTPFGQPTPTPKPTLPSYCGRACTEATGCYVQLGDHMMVPGHCDPAQNCLCVPDPTHTPTPVTPSPTGPTRTPTPTFTPVPTFGSCGSVCDDRPCPYHSGSQILLGYCVVQAQSDQCECAIPATPTPTPTPCTGDCDGSASVTVEELVQCVNAALGTDTACSACDANGDGRVTVDELVEAVDHALNGCAGSG
jgi:YVTN family beta-propeller protein